MSRRCRATTAARHAAILIALCSEIGADVLPDPDRASEPEVEAPKPTTSENVSQQGFVSVASLKRPDTSLRRGYVEP
jgi:hypothetical protein